MRKFILLIVMLLLLGICKTDTIGGALMGVMGAGAAALTCNTTTPIISWDTSHQNNGIGFSSEACEWLNLASPITNGVCQVKVFTAGTATGHVGFFTSSNATGQVGGNSSVQTLTDGGLTTFTWSSNYPSPSAGSVYLCLLPDSGSPVVGMNSGYGGSDFSLCIDGGGCDNTRALIFYVYSMQ